MAVLSGLHVLFGFSGSGAEKNPQPVFRSMHSSETLTGTSGTTTKTAPAALVDSVPMVRVLATANSWVSVGKPGNTDVTATGPRAFCRAEVEYDFACKEGDEVEFAVDA